MYKIATALLVAGQASAADVCRALVLSGGGNNGAWETGVFYGLLNNGAESDYAYDVVTGVSAGSINTVAMAGWEVGSEKALADWLTSLWKNLSSADVWQDWTFGKVQGMTLKGGAVDNSPLLAYLRETLAPYEAEGYKRRVTVSTVEVDTGVYTEFDQKNLQFSELPDAAVASASIPFVFPPHVWEGKGVFMDGGTVYNVNLEGAVRQCMDGIVDDESKIVIDVFICGAPDEPSQIEEVGHTWTNYFRGRTINKFYSDTDSLAQSMHGHPDVQMRHVIKQTTGAMSGLSELNFDGDYTWPAQEQGRKDAVDALNSGNGGVAMYFYEWLASEDVRSEFAKVGDYIQARQAEDLITGIFEEKLFN